MPKNIVISGETLSGKTLVALGIASRLRADGKSVSYFKPVGEKSFEISTSTQHLDEDAVVMKEVLGMDADVKCICPIVRTLSGIDEFLKVGHDALFDEIASCYSKVSQDMDYVIIEGTKAPWHMLHVGLSTAQLAKDLDAQVICLVNFPDITSIDDILLQRDFFNAHGVERIAIILNMVPPMLKSTIVEKVEPFLRDNDLGFCGAIYTNRELFSPTIRDILRVLGGEMILGQEKIDDLIDSFLVGSMAPENALKWFRRSVDKAVITSGDRSDICLAALETDTNLLILTGGLGPDIRTLSRAKEQGVPIMMTAHDTYTTSRLVDGLVGTIDAENKEKIAAIERIIGDALHIDCLL
ncbi:MAG: phosphotransacetylase family protein [Candidatus Thorarchaeota archaeon]|nr:phosphotransacetylase family protein [Candidatus Thorarchaeota archaeon]